MLARIVRASAPYARQAMRDTETLAESIAAFVSILALIAVVMLACLAMMQPAHAADAMIAAPASCVAWIIPTAAIGAVVGGLAVALFLMARAIRPAGDDVADHENNMAAALRAESIKGDDR